MSPARRLRLKCLPPALSVLQGGHASLLQSCRGPRGGEVRGRGPPPGKAGARGAAGPAGSRTGWGRHGGHRARLPSSTLPAGAGPSGASPGLGGRGAAGWVPPRARPLGGTSFPWARSLPPQPVDGQRPAPGRGEPASSLGGRLPARRVPERTASKVEVKARPPPWAARGWREPLAVELVLGDYGEHSSGPQAGFS